MRGSVRAFLVMLPMMLGGCGLVPPAVTLISFAADAVSYAASGKSVSDHGLSLAMQQDCAVFNLVQGEAICGPGPHPQFGPVVHHDRETLVELAALRTHPAPDNNPPDRMNGSYLAAGPLLSLPPDAELQAVSDMDAHLLAAGVIVEESLEAAWDEAAVKEI